MTLKNPSMNFYDSDFDSRNESKIFDDLLNEASLASPEKSISCIFDNSSLNDLHGMLVYSDEKEELKKIKDQKIHKLSGNKDKFELSCEGNHLKTTDVHRKGLSSERDLKLSVTNSGYLGVNEKKWVSLAKRNLKPRFGDLDLEVEKMKFSEISEVINLLKKNEEEPECIFTSTCLHECQKTFRECDWNKFKKRSSFEMDGESEKIEPKIRVPVSRSDYDYHKLSTIPEVDSLFMDECAASVMNEDKCGSLLNHDSKITKFLKANDSFDLFTKQKASSNFPANVMKVIQNKHIEKLLQEPGILEESDLTLISTDFESLSEISKKTTEQSHCHSYYKSKRFYDDESPSLVSFLQHELSCMKDCTDE